MRNRMKYQRRRLPVAEQIRKGLEEAFRHAKGEITLRVIALERPDPTPEADGSNSAREKS